MPALSFSLAFPSRASCFLSLSYHEILSADALDGPAGIPVKKKEERGGGRERNVSREVFFFSFECRCFFNAPPPSPLRSSSFFSFPLFLSLSFTHSVLARGAARAAAPSLSPSLALRGGMGGEEKGLSSRREKKRERERGASESSLFSFFRSMVSFQELWRSDEARIATYKIECES